MSISRAIAIGKTLRWYHLGFAFLWATTFAGLSYPSGAAAENVQAFKLCNQVFVVVAILLMVAVVRAGRYRMSHPGRDRGPCLGWGRALRPSYAILPGLLLSSGVLLFYVSFYLGRPSTATSLAAGALVGCASGLFYVMWQRFYTSEGATRTALYIPLSAVASAILCFLVRLLPFDGSLLCAILIFPFLAAFSLAKVLAEMEPGEAVVKRGSLKGAVRDLWKPVFCVCSIGFVWKLVSNMFGGTDSLTLSVVLVGFSFAALVIALVELFSEKGFDVLGSYQVLFPLVTGAFLLPSLLGVQFAPVLSGTLMFGFEVVNLLLIVMCAVYANERALPSTYVYALGLCPAYVAMFAGDVLGTQLNLAFAYDLSVVIGVLFLCVYMLSCTMFLVSWTKRRKQEGASAVNAGEDVAKGITGNGTKDALPASVPTSVLEEALSASFSSKLESLCLSDPLSQREREVAALLVRGYSVAAVSRELFISENTVRGHTKSIYRKLDVHSKQQLIDLMAGR